jgi:CheY-like chemotaxis protein
MLRILIAEDNDEDFVAFQRVLSRSNSATLIRCCDGEEVINYLRKALDGADSRPSIILLDINMPGTDGRETLVRLKSDSAFRSIPIVVFSTSTRPKDIVDCYEQGANGYMSKPVNYMELERNLCNLLDYWEHTMLLP